LPATGLVSLVKDARQSAFQDGLPGDNILRRSEERHENSPFINADQPAVAKLAIVWVVKAFNKISVSSSRRPVEQRPH
jgi:hypothetical protein